MNIFAAIWRFITFQNLRQGAKVQNAGDAVFTKDAAGRAAAFDIERDRLVTDYNEFLAALSEAELAVEQKTGRLETMKKQRQEAQKALDGAVNVYTQAKAANDTEKMEKAQTAGKEYQAKVKRLEEQEATLQSEIEAQQASFKNLERQLAKMKERIASLPADKADSIANYVSNQAFIKAQERLDGILTRAQESPLDAVLKADQELAAKAKVVGKLAGQDKSLEHDEYLKAAEGESADQDFAALVQAKQAEKASATGTTEAVTEERPKI
ncbi:MAG: hypothetical protein WC028_23675 [Candidatus Obscuribacterales bacterium]